MDDEQIKKMIEDNYDSLEEGTISSMLGDFYNRKMASIVIFIWMWAIVFMAGIVYSAVKFFKTDQTQYQLMYVAIFVSLIQFVAILKVFAWQMIHRNSIKREIKRLELRIVELGQMVKGE
jgi:hypothetical protein